VNRSFVWGVIVGVAAPVLYHKFVKPIPTNAG
jgi:hypothetical protein